MQKQSDFTKNPYLEENPQVVLTTITQGVGALANASLDELVAASIRQSVSKDLAQRLANPAKLIRYCIKHGHWSILDTVGFGVEIEAQEAIIAQFIRHTGLKPQQYSQRYQSNMKGFYPIELRAKTANNRQSSSNLVDLPTELLEELHQHQAQTLSLYNRLVDAGVAPECARFILPRNAYSKVYFNGTLRSWVTVLNARLYQDAQKEARFIANQIKDIFISVAPIISEALYNFEGAQFFKILDRIAVEAAKEIGNIS